MWSEEKGGEMFGRFRISHHARFTLHNMLRPADHNFLIRGVVVGKRLFAIGAGGASAENQSFLFWRWLPRDDTPKKIEMKNILVLWSPVSLCMLLDNLQFKKL